MHPLAGIRVIECGIAVAGPVAACYLARLGAEVIKIESRAAGRGIGNRPPAWAPPDLGLAATDLGAGNNTFNSEKTSLGLELKTPEGQALLDRLLVVSDVFLTNLSAPALATLGLDRGRVRAASPNILYVSMTGFGDSPGPYRWYRAWGPNLSALAGLDELTGTPDRPPVMPPVPLPDYLGAFHAVVAVLAALDYRQATGVAQEIDLSQLDGCVAAVGPYVGQVSAGAGTPRRQGNRNAAAAPSGVFPCRGDDRWVAITVTSDAGWRGLGAAAGAPAWSRDPRYASVEGRLAHEDELEAAIGSWTRTATAQEIALRLQMNGVAAAPVQDCWDQLADPQLQARHFWRLAGHDRLGVDVVAGLPLRFSATPACMERAAPSLGSGNTEVLVELLGLRDGEVRRLEAAGVLCPMAPLPERYAKSGVRLQRPYWPWALPLLRLPRGEEEAPPVVVPAMEAEARESRPEGDGAGDPLSSWERARVRARPLEPGVRENGIASGRAPGTRPHPSPLPGGEGTSQPEGEGTAALAGSRVLDLSDALSAYGTKLLAGLGADVLRIEPPEASPRRRTPPLHQGISLTERYLDGGKRSVSLDLTVDAGKDGLRKLVLEADVLFESFPPGHLASLGLGWEALRALNPRLVLVSVTTFGQTGPYRDWEAEELTLWALSGLLQLTGYPDRPPVIPGAGLARYYIGATGAVAALAALQARARTGRGQWVDVSGHETLVMVSQAGAGMLMQIEDLVPRRRAGSRFLGTAPYGFFACRDRLVCLLAIFTEHWDALARWIADETGREAVLDPRFRQSPAVRYAHADDITAHINALTGRYDAATLFAEAQRRGIPAAPVNSVADMLADPHLAAQDFWVEVDQPGLGSVRWPGPPYRLSATPAAS
jgi:benzylsuccinate CoA-transferase BbsF subunit